MRALFQNSDTVSKNVSSNLDQMQGYIARVVDQFVTLNAQIKERDKKMTAISALINEIDSSVTEINQVMSMLTQNT